MRELRKIILILLMLITLGLGVVGYLYSDVPGCREGIKCDDVGCDGGLRGCAYIPCNGYPVLCLRS